MGVRTTGGMKLLPFAIPLNAFSTLTSECFLDLERVIFADRLDFTQCCPSLPLPQFHHFSNVRKISVDFLVFTMKFGTVFNGFAKLCFLLRANVSYGNFNINAQFLRIWDFRPQCV